MRSVLRTIARGAIMIIGAATLLGGGIDAANDRDAVAAILPGSPTAPQSAVLAVRADPASRGGTRGGTRGSPATPGSPDTPDTVTPDTTQEPMRATPTPVPTVAGAEQPPRVAVGPAQVVGAGVLAAGLGALFFALRRLMTGG